MWATCCNWFCLDGQPEEGPPAQGARTQAYSNPGYSSFPSPTGSEPSCKACGTHFANTARKVSVDFLAFLAATTSGPWASLLTLRNAGHLAFAYAVPGTRSGSFHKSIKEKLAKSKAAQR